MKDKRVLIVAICCVIWFGFDPKPDPIVTLIIAIAFA
jgi:hypothetical protein